MYFFIRKFIAFFFSHDIFIYVELKDLVDMNLRKSEL